MMNARLPESRPTRVVEKRNEWVRLQLEKKKEDKLREQSMMKQKQMKERELGAWLKTLIDMNEEERKSKYPGYIELSATQRLAAERAAEGKEVYKAAYKANQKRLHDAVQSRPSLIERHDNAIGALHASDAALEMLTGDEDDDEDEDDDDDDYDDDDDLFDEDEKLVLKAKQSVQE
jgi:PAS domain-containing protein